MHCVVNVTEDDAAADGVIMSKRALDKLKRRDGQ